MAFDKPTRNRLAKFVADARDVISDEFTEQFQSLYGISATGEITALEDLRHLDDAGLAIAERLRERIDYLVKTHPDDENGAEMAVKRLAREQAFTILNRFAAVRMAEKRGLIEESVGQGYQSKGFTTFEYVAGSGIGEIYERYRRFLFCLFDELTIDLGVLFDRTSPSSLLFPRETSLLALLELFRAGDLKRLWEEDETVGWIYQYYNDPEERKKMRKESAAPRNSRELAVRNQFFTPRYVVEFLTDNALGRIWYEMSRGQTRLADQCRYLVRRPSEIFLAEGETAPETPDQEGLSQEELLRQPVHIPHRPIKDPREIRLLDPACGSMHFGLYAFDLFEAIYEEAWELEGGGDLVREDPGLNPLRKTYESREDYLRDVPRLIIEHNIHGVDIDPRAVQIAVLSLWLRAQKAWQAQGVTPADRPRVRRSNIVCAEPMPGSPEMLEEFVQTLDLPLLGELVKTVFEKMELAGEAGTLLKIEEEIRSAIDSARKAWDQLESKPRELFSTEELNETTNQPELSALEKSLTTGRRVLTADFWDTAEQQVIDALRGYAEQADADSYQRRLFADDAARGFAFVDLCRKRYDAVVMNPPFGEPCARVKPIIRAKYPEAKPDIYAAFVVWCTEILDPNGRIGVLSSRTGFFLPSLEEYRRKFLFGSTRLHLVADLGLGVLDDALVEAAAYVITSASEGSSTFISCLAARDKDLGLLRAIEKLPNSEVFLRNADFFKKLPQEVVAYWVDNSIAEIFDSCRSVEDCAANVRIGLQTSNDYRFLRLVWEVSPKDLGRGRQWVQFAKGGEYQLFYDDIHLSVNWADEAAEMKAFAELHASRTGSMAGNGPLRAFDFYYRGGLTYPERTTSEFNPRLLPDGCITGTVGPGIHVEGKEKRAVLLGWLSTRLVRELLEIGIGLGDAVESGSAARHYNVRMIGRTPFPRIDEQREQNISNSVIDLVRLSAHQWSFDETARNFCRFRVSRNSGLTEIFKESQLEIRTDKLKVIEIHKEVEDAFISCFDNEPAIRAQLDGDIGPHPAGFSTKRREWGTEEIDSLSLSLDKLIDQCAEALGNSRQVTKKSYISDRRIELLSLLHKTHPALIVHLENELGFVDSLFHYNACKAFVSFTWGVIFGRWDIRYATGERQPPELPDPFDPLPVCPPGMLQNADELPAEPKDVPVDYPLHDIPWSGILVDDENHPKDIVARVREAIEVIWKDRAEAIEEEACEILGVNSLRDYFRRPAAFFADHLKRYSKSRRQAPIYWPLSTKSGSYTLWLYYHRLDDRTLHICLADFLDPKIKKTQKELDDLTASGQSGSRVGELRDFLDELHDLRDEIERVIKLPWRPNLNDGVLITASPLHKLFGLAAWRTKLEACWIKLEKGDYDWAHLAYSIRPKQVEKACETDRSIAIAHDREDLCKVEPPKPKKKRAAKKAAKKKA
ncbi:BREX-1 system adenine-specific DNA-methyltransferase PglX [Verrucomicrobiales bacterium]|nr:BREX-1 system adenine-specific DNA-methyltransferase PglX [Verrucomicrobiales bacterium]